MKLILCLMCLLVTDVSAAELVSGPMVGHTTTSTADIWVETDKSADFVVKYWTLDGGEKHVLVRREEKSKTTKAYPHTGTVTLKGLAAGSRVHYEVHVDGRVVRAL